jgi:hypothetical protein
MPQKAKTALAVIPHLCPKSRRTTSRGIGYAAADLLDHQVSNGLFDLIVGFAPRV